LDQRKCPAGPLLGLTRLQPHRPGAAAAQEEITHCRAGVRWLSHLHAAAHAASADAGAPAWAADARGHAVVATWFHELVRTNFKGSLKVRNARAGGRRRPTPGRLLPAGSCLACVHMRGRARLAAAHLRGGCF